MIGTGGSVHSELDDIGRSAHNDLTINELNPIIMGNAVYSFIPTNFNTYTSGSGQATTSSNLLQVSSGTSSGNYGVIRSFRASNNRMGMGSIFRGSARFPSNVANSSSGFGFFNIGDEISFGYNGTAFGIWHRYGGKAEVQTLTLTVGAGGAETAIFELWANTTLGGTYNFQAVGTNLISDVDVAGTTLTGGTLMASFAVAKGTTLAVDLADFRIKLPPSTRLTISGYMTSGAAADLTASLTWYEYLY